MKINLEYSKNDVTKTTETDKKITISDDFETFFFQMFTKNIYSNPIGSIVREITSNCFDSHIEAGVNKPVVIKLSHDKQADKNYISFIDFGVGMSPERIENVFSVMLNSTKRQTNDQIGGFGLGSKVPLAYRRVTGHGSTEYDNSYHIITNYNGIKYYYMIYDSNKSPVMSLLHQEKTNEGNGTEVRIPVLSNDILKFINEIKSQLAYFENLVFEGFAENVLNNDYKIVNGKHFLYRPDIKTDVMHVCLGRVKYPIDYNVLELSSYDHKLPVGIKFNIGEINVTSNREALDYNQDTIDLIKMRIKLVKNELTEIANKTYSNIESLEDYIKFRDSFGTINLTDNVQINVKDILRIDNIKLDKFRYNNFRIPPTGVIFNTFFRVNSYGKAPSRSYYSNNRPMSGEYDKLKNVSYYHYTSETFDRKNIKQGYLKQKHVTYYIVHKIKDKSLDLHRIIDDFVIKNELIDENNKFSPEMEQILKLRDEYYDIILKHSNGDYDEIQVPDEFKKKRNAANKDLANLEINIKLFNNSHKIPFSLISNANYLIFYCDSSDEYKLRSREQIYSTLFNSETLKYYYSDKFHARYSSNGKNYTSGVLFITLSKSNMKYMKTVKNAYHIDEFDNKLLRRKRDIIEAYFTTSKEFLEYLDLPSIFRSHKFGKVHGLLGTTITQTNQFISENDHYFSKSSELSLHEKTFLDYFKFDLDKIKKKSKYAMFISNIEYICNSYNKNAEIFNYVQNGYYDNEWSDTFVEILKKVMVF